MITRSRDLAIAFVADEATLRRLADVLRSISANIEYRVGLVDGTDMDLETLEEVLAVQNSTPRRITSLSLSASDRPRYAHVRLKERGAISPIEYSISGSVESDVLYTSGRVEEVLSGMRQWYTRFAFLDFVSAFFIIMSVVWGAGITVISLVAARWGPAINRDAVGMAIVNAMLMSLVLFVVALILSYLRGRLFPYAVFLVGDGINRHRSVVFWRRTIGGTLIVGVLASMIGTWLIR